MQCDRTTGWFPWIPQGPADFDQSPYQYAEVLLARQEWDTLVRVRPCTLDPLMNVVDLWWRPCQETRMPDDTLAHMQQLCQQVSALAQALEDGPAMPGGGTLQSIADTAWNALTTLALALEDWCGRQEEDPHG